MRGYQRWPVGELCDYTETVVLCGIFWIDLGAFKMEDCEDLEK